MAALSLLEVSSRISRGHISLNTGMDTSPEADGEGDELSQVVNGEPSRSSRLARKAESARQARLRHKQYVTELQEQVAGLQSRIRSMEIQYGSQATAHQAVTELKTALTQEQNSQLHKWLQQSHGEHHVLRRYQHPPPVLPPQPLVQSGSTPIAIGGTSRDQTSPMESDEDTFAMSRSWDDIEGARSILNLHTPNGFHPLGANTDCIIPTSFSLPTAASSAPSHFPMHFTSFTPSGAASTRQS